MQFRRAVELGIPGCGLYLSKIPVIEDRVVLCTCCGVIADPSHEAVSGPPSAGDSRAEPGSAGTIPHDRR